MTTPRRSSGSSSVSTSAEHSRGVFDLELVEKLPSLIAFRVSGPGAKEAFAEEAGGHRWQRVPPNEKRGRVHTSTVTVAVLAEPTAAEIEIPDADLEITTTRGSGPGGQHRNKTETCVVIRHRPTGITVTERSQSRNREIGMALLRARVWELERRRADRERDARRRAQVGSGMRGDKRRTIRFQDGRVTDHPTGRRWLLREYLRGEW